VNLSHYSTGLTFHAEPPGVIPRVPFEPAEHGLGHHVAICCLWPGANVCEGACEWAVVCEGVCEWAV